MYAYSPAELFGSLVSETDEFLDLHSQVTPDGKFSPTNPNVFRLPSAPPRTNDGKKNSVTFEDEADGVNIYFFNIISTENIRFITKKSFFFRLE